MHQYGWLAFGERDWKRYQWRCRAAERGYGASSLHAAFVELLPSFENGECGRILHTVGPVVRSNLDVAKCASLGRTLDRDERRKLERGVALCAAMMGRARRAVDCWSMAGRRRGVVKDMRVMIAKMLWAEAWRWSEKEISEKVGEEEASTKAD
jgi:hypothetical protein